MRFPLLFSFVFFVLLCGIVHAAENICTDDARLAHLPALLRDGLPIEPPLTLTPETYARLDPHAAARLGTSGRICPNTPLSKEGTLLIPISIPFYVLMEQMLICARDQEWDCIKRLHKNFRAAPLPAVAIPSLLFQPNVTPEARNQWAKTLGIFIKTYSTFMEKEHVLLMTDIFKAFRGEVQNPQKILLLGVNETSREVRELRAMLASKPEIIIVSFESFLQSIEASLKNLGFEVKNVTSQSQARELRQQLIMNP